MVYAAPPANASDSASPVTASDVPVGKLIEVGARTAGLPTGSDGIDSLITTAYELIARPVYRRKLLFDMLATTKPTMDSHNGAVVQMNVVNDLDDDPTTATLVEDYDVLPSPLASWKSPVIINEYGRAVTKTALARGTSMVPLDPIAAERVGRNAAATMDRLARTTLLASGGIKNDGTAGGAVTDIHVANKPSDTLRTASSTFKTNNVEPFDNGLYVAVLSPSGELALRKEADAAGFRYWQVHQEPNGGTGSIAGGYVGTYEGFEIYVTTGVSSAVGGIYVGKDALAKAWSAAPGYGPEPEIVVAPVIDKLKRFASIGWYWMGGYARFRAEAVLVGDPAATS